MGPAVEVKKLCETWWTRLMDSTKGEQYRFAEQFLRLLGWESPARVEVVDAGAVCARPSGISYILRGTHAGWVGHFVMPGSLEPPSSLVERNLDFCETTRYLVDASRALHVPYVFVTDLYRSYLYDARTEELLLFADTPADFTREFTGVLTREDVERGSLEEIRRQPRSYVARQLREWCQRWCKTLAVELAQPEESATLLIDRIIVLRYLLEHDILNSGRYRLRQRVLALIKAAVTTGGHQCGRDLLRLFHDLWADWKAELFAPNPSLETVLEKDSLTASLLREFVLLAGSKFTVPTILESFNYGEAPEKARVRMIPEENAERQEYLGKQTPETIDAAVLVLDLEDEGYRAIAYWLDRLIAVYERLDAAFDYETARRDVMRLQTEEDLDLFSWSELDANRPAALADKLEYAIEHGLKLYYNSARQYRTGRLMLYIHFIDRHEQHHHRFVRFPRIEAAFAPRPHMTETDRKRIFDETPDTQDWEVV